MIATQRQELIVEVVRRQGVASVSDLARELGISESTVRRDLSELAAEGRLVKVHGGATSLEEEHVLRDLTLVERASLHASEKSTIARYAAGLIGDDDCVYLDAGTSVQALVDELGKSARPSALFVTDSVTIGMSLVSMGMRAVLLGGELKSATEALVGPEAIDTIAHFHFTLGFWGTNGIDSASGFTTPDRGEAQIKRISMQHCQRRYVLADASKFNRRASISFAGLEAATILCDFAPEPYKSLDNVYVVSPE